MKWVCTNFIRGSKLWSAMLSGGERTIISYNPYAANPNLPYSIVGNTQRAFHTLEEAQEYAVYQAVEKELRK